ncbi:hypothetical protein L0U85_01185 [Glycomyces sp. L485]|uniref:hypothetical protein n=1 Tax=Glycomyces sp. L485 TaxID=2909235 RepID=UPI001F4B1551|nr:hypothetical protein [Glycomyces sp. L485]MCH7229481.1 hypothetical protein [Glycomyces sp. L485]
MNIDTPSRSDDRDSTTSKDVVSDPPVDRMAVHVVWEIGLLLLAGGVLFALTQSASGPFAEGSWSGLMAALAPAVMAASAAAVSLRLGAVNLAVGPVALMSAWIFIDASSSGTAVALAMGLGVALFSGVVLATLCTWLRVPGWAASGALGGAVGLWSGTVDDPAAFMLSALPNTGVLAALAAAAGLSMFLGLVGAFAGVRERLAPIRDTPPGERHGKGVLVFLGLLLSTSLAGAAGVIAVWSGVPENGAAALPDPILLSVVAVGAALLGGTSLLGRRGGVCGTVFAATLLLALMWLAEARGWDLNPSWIALGAIIAGFLVTRLVEAMNDTDEAELASSSRAGAVDDLREDDPAVPDQPDGGYQEYDEDLAAVGSGGDPWSTTGSMPRAGDDPFGASGVFDDLREPNPRDGFESSGGARYDDAERRFLR